MSGISSLLILGAVVTLVGAFHWYRFSLLCTLNSNYVVCIRELGAGMISMLKDLKAKDKTNDWWLEFGSLLSLARNQPPMPWDNDVDFGMVIPPTTKGGVSGLVQRIKQYHDNLPQERRFTHVNYPTINPKFVNKVGYSSVIQFQHNICHSDIFLYQRHHNASVPNPEEPAMNSAQRALVKVHLTQVLSCGLMSYIVAS
jgi:hypothetical protein